MLRYRIRIVLLALGVIGGYGLAYARFTGHSWAHHHHHCSVDHENGSAAGAGGAK